MKTKLLVVLFLFVALIINLELNAQSTLSAGDVVILEFNGNGTDGFSFMPLVHLQTGTQIHFTDYGWGGSSFQTDEESGGANGNMITYTAPSAISAGTMIRQNSANIGGSAFTLTAGWPYQKNNSNFIVAFMTTVAGHDGLIAFQGTPSEPTFIWAWQSGSWGGTDFYWNSKLPTGLTNGVNAIYFADLSSGSDSTVDDGYYSGPTTATTMAGWRARVANSANWTTLASGTAPALLYPGSFTVTDALPVELTSFTASTANNKVSLNWQTATEVNNYGFEVERSIKNEKLEITNWEKVGFIEGHGNSNSPQKYSFTDKPNTIGKIIYRLKQIDIDGKFEYSPNVEVNFYVPTEFSVEQNYPNPFNPITKIEFSIPSENNVEVKVFNVLGVEVTTLLNKRMEAGRHSVEFDSNGLSSGIYFYQVVSGSYSTIKKMVLLR